MLEVFLFALKELSRRRIGVILLALGLTITAGMVYMLDFDTASDGSVMVSTFGGMSASASIAIPRIFKGVAEFASSVWIFVVLFGLAPLVTSYLDPGWAELLVSKGIARWKILLGRYLSTVTLAALALVLLPGLTGLYFWTRSGLPSPLNLIGGLALLILSYASILALMALVGLIHRSPVLPIMVAFLILVLSAMLRAREGIYGPNPREWVRVMFDWTYYILPKTSELNNASIVFFQKAEMAEWWWPIWTTSVFLLAMLGIAVLLFRRKSF